jgi:acetolactate synthase-1/2/3 large subunit
VINDLWRATRDTTRIVVTDVGQHQMWEAQYYHHERPRSLITSGGLGTMGFAVPAAIGAKRARPEAESGPCRRRRLPDDDVRAGDGGAGRDRDQGRDHQQRLPRDGRQWQEFFYERRYAATPLSGPDFVKLAEAFGIRAAAVRARREVDDAIADARRHDGPALIDFRVEQEDTVYPMVPAGADLHAMIRRPNPIVETAAD